MKANQTPTTTSRAAMGAIASAAAAIPSLAAAGAIPDDPIFAAIAEWRSVHEDWVAALDAVDGPDREIMAHRQRYEQAGLAPYEAMKAAGRDNPALAKRCADLRAIADELGDQATDLLYDCLPRAPVTAAGLYALLKLFDEQQAGMESDAAAAMMVSALPIARQLAGEAA